MDFATALQELNSSSADIEASALISIDGLPIASALPADVDEDRIGAMSAALLSIGERAVRELSRGALDRILIQGANGFVILTAVGTETVLTVTARPEAKLGLLFLSVKRAAQTLEGVL